MIRLASIIGLALTVAAPAASVARTSSGPGGPGHVVVVKMVEIPGQQYRFEPAAVAAQPGDTLRWVQETTVPHNVQFASKPKGARLGGAEMGPYLTNKGAVYQLVVDARFAPGSYAYVCTPHAALGMKGTITVTPR